MSRKSIILGLGLTWYAGNERLLPLAAMQAFDDRVEFLSVTVLAVVSHHGVGLVTQALLSEHFSMGYLWRLAAKS